MSPLVIKFLKMIDRLSPTEQKIPQPNHLDYQSPIAHTENFSDAGNNRFTKT
jgi:hypothetical protein